MSTLGQIRDYMAQREPTRTEFTFQDIQPVLNRVEQRLPEQALCDFEEIDATNLRNLLIYLVTDNPTRSMREVCGTPLSRILITSQGDIVWKALSPSSLVVVLGDMIWHITRSGRGSNVRLDLELTSSNLVAWARNNDLIQAERARSISDRINSGLFSLNTNEDFSV